MALGKEKARADRVANNGFASCCRQCTNDYAKPVYGDLTPDEKQKMPYQRRRTGKPSLCIKRRKRIWTICPFSFSLFFYLLLLCLGRIALVRDSASACKTLLLIRCSPVIDPSVDSQYGYVPTEYVAIIFIALFSISTRKAPLITAMPRTIHSHPSPSRAHRTSCILSHVVDAPDGRALRPDGDPRVGITALVQHIAPLRHPFHDPVRPLCILSLRPTY